MTAVLLSVALLAAGNLLGGEDFSAGWREEIPAGVVVMRDGGVLTLRADKVDGYPRLVQDFTPEPGALYGAEVLAKDEGITGGYGAYMTVEFAGADGQRINYEQSSPAMPGAWTPLIARAVAPAGAAKARMCLVLRGAGAGLWKEPKLTLLEHAPAGEVPAEVAVQFGPPVQAPFLGFGVEDDGWLCTKNNYDHGVTEADIERIHDRTAWMRPANVRMFFWYQDFNPSGDWRTFDFESENMRSHYRALDVYQQLGTPVNVTGVEWSVKEPWSKPEALAHAVGELFTELITKRGYTCVQQWTLTNEPNTHFLREGASFATYRDLHTLVAKEFAARGLKIAIIGSDDTNGGLPWFKSCVEDADYAAACPLMASHFYLQKEALRAGRYNILDRLQLLGGRKPFLVEEFGFQDARSGAIVNPLMEDFDYALLAAGFALDAVALGTSGLNIWCLHELEYPVGYMSYGLFRYKDKDWSPKPVWYAWSMLTRNTRPGEAVRGPVTPLPAGLVTVQIGATTYFVNPTAQPVRFVCEEAKWSAARVFDEGCLPASTEEAAVRAAAEGRDAALSGGGVTIPARAFGWAR